MLDVAAWLTVIAYAWFAVMTIALTLVDIKYQRLPNTMVISTLVGTIVLLGAANVVSDLGLRPVQDMFIGGAALFTLYLVLGLLSRGALGGGDVKLAAAVGAMLGYHGFATLFFGAVTGFVLAGVFSLILLASRRAQRHTRIPYGPFMLAGAWVGLLV